MGLQTEVVKASEAIKAYSKLFAVKGNNLAQVNNPNYAKQSVYLQSSGEYVTSNGVESFPITTSDITDARSQLLDQEIIIQKNLLATLEGKQNFDSSLEAFFDADIQSLDKPQDSPYSSGFSKFLNDFFTSFDSLATRPSDPGQKNLVFSNAQTLITQFNNFSQNFQTINDNIAYQINNDLGQVNVILSKIAKLNEQISYLELGRSQLDLEDRNERQAALEDLGKFINFTVAPSTSAVGSIDIFVANASNPNVSILQYNAFPTSLTFNGTNVVTTASTPDTITLTGGKIAGYLQFQSTTLAKTKLSLDNLASQLVSSVNAIYNPSSSSNNFFLASGTSSSSIAFDPSISSTNISATSTSNAGANEIALAIAKLANQKFSTSSSNLINGTFSQAFANTVSDLGNTIKINKQNLIAQSKLQDSLLSRRESITSVSLDEEISDILVLQTSYAAIAGFMKVLRELESDVTRKIG